MFNEIIQIRDQAGAVSFEVPGPPEHCTVLGSTDLTTRSGLGEVINSVGTAPFTDSNSHFGTRKFYRARSQLTR